MALFKAFVLLATFTLSENLQISPKEASGVIKSVQKHFQVQCIVFVTVCGTFREQLKTLETRKEIDSFDTVFTSALDMKSLLSAQKKINNICSQRLFVIQIEATELRRLLVKLSPVVRQFQSSLWLLLASGSSSMVDAFQGVFIPYDVQLFVGEPQPDGAVNLVEAFRVASNHSLQIQQFGRWTQRSGLEARDRCLQIRRPNLNGLTLRLAEYHNPPISITRDNPQGLESSFQTEIWHILEKSLNFSTKYRTEEGTWGNQLPDGSWDGMIAMLLKGEVDVASVTPMFTERAQVAAFTFPLYDSDYNVYLRKFFGKTVAWSEWLHPFTPLLWTAFLLLSLATGVLMVVLSELVRRHGRDEKYMTVYDQVFLVYGAIICQQGQEGTPVSWPCRIIYFISYFTGIIVISSYSATIVSKLTVASLHLPFRDLEGLFRDGGFGLGALVSSFSFTLFQKADHGLLKQLYDKTIKQDPDNFIEESVDGFLRACTSRFGYISTPETLVVVQDLLREKNCVIVALPSKFMHFVASFMFPKNSPYVGLFNHEILRLLNDGVLRKTYATYMELPREGSDSVPFTEIKIEDVTPMLGIVVGGIANGVVLLGLEFLALFVIKKYGVLSTRGPVQGMQNGGAHRARGRETRVPTFGSAIRTRHKELYPHYQGIQRRRMNRNKLNI